MNPTKQIGRVKSIIYTTFHEVEELVHEVYGKTIPELNEDKYEFVAIQECENDSMHEFNIDGKLSNYDQKKWDKREFNYNNSLIINKLCSDGYIMSGCYLVEVSW